MNKKEKKSSSEDASKEDYEEFLSQFPSEKSANPPSKEDLKKLKDALKKVEKYDAVNQPKYRDRRTEPAEIARQLDLPDSKAEAYAQYVAETAKNIKSDLESKWGATTKKFFPAKRTEITSDMLQTDVDNIDAEIVDLRKEIVGDSNTYKRAVAKYIESKPSTYSKIISKVNPIDMLVQTKAALSELKLKLEASKYGITPEQFEEAKKSKEGLYGVWEKIKKGQEAEMASRSKEANIQKIYADAYAERAQGVQRYARAEKTLYDDASDKRLIQFGFKGFVGDSEPIYLYSSGSHSAVRAKILPKTTSLKPDKMETKIAMLRMRESLLSPPRINPLAWKIRRR
ncbi:MAG: hypothetical protein ABIM30_06020 [candidate division WOR-3 bacterium]